MFVFPQLVGVTWWTKHKPATEKEERSNKDDVEMTENLNKLANEENQGKDLNDKLQIRFEALFTCKSIFQILFQKEKKCPYCILEVQIPHFFISIKHV